MRILVLTAIVALLTITAKAKAAAGPAANTCSPNDAAIVELTKALNEHIELERRIFKLTINDLEQAWLGRCSLSGNINHNKINDLLGRLDQGLSEAENATAAERILTRALIKKINQR